MAFATSIIWTSGGFIVMDEDTSIVKTYLPFLGFIITKVAGNVRLAVKEQWDGVNFAKFIDGKTSMKDIDLLWDVQSK